MSVSSRKSFYVDMLTVTTINDGRGRSPNGAASERSMLLRNPRMVENGFVNARGFCGVGGLHVGHWDMAEFSVPFPLEN